MTDYDVTVLGGGPAGEHCAGHLAEGGLKVAIVERELLGGECSFWACIPSKTLLRPGDRPVRGPASGARLRGRPVGVEMGQAVARMGGSVAIVEGMDHVLPREPEPLGAALGEALASEGVELCFGQPASAARFEDGEYVLEFPERDELRGDRLLVATGRRPRVEDLGLETVGVEPGKRGIEVDARMSAGDGLWAIGDVAGIWPLTYVGKYHGRVVAANILGGHREADYSAVGGVHGPAGGRGRRV